MDSCLLSEVHATDFHVRPYCTHTKFTHLNSPSTILLRAAQAHWVLRHRHTGLTPDDHAIHDHAPEFSFYYSAACCTGTLGSQAQAHWIHTCWPRSPWSRTWFLLLLFCCVLHRRTGFSGTGTLDSHLMTTQSMITHLNSPSPLLLRAAQAHWMGCIFFFVARAEGKSDSSWVGGARERFERNEGWVRWVSASVKCCRRFDLCRAGQNRIYTSYMTVYSVIYLTKMPYTQRICYIYGYG